MEIAERWRNAQRYVIDNDFFYVLGGRDFVRGMDCSGYAAFVLAEIGLELYVNGANPRAVWALDIWRDEPDLEGFGRAGNLLAMYFSRGASADGGPDVPYGHVAVRYNSSFYTEVTGRSVKVNGQQSLLDILRKSTNFLETFINPDGSFNRTTYDDYFTGLQTAHTKIISKDLEYFLSIAGSFDDLSYRGETFPDPTVAQSGYFENGPQYDEDDPDQLAQVIQTVVDAHRKAYDLISVWLGNKEIVNTADAGSTVVDVAVSRQLSPSMQRNIEWVGDKLQAAGNRTNALTWIAQQAAGVNYEQESLKTGIQTGGISNLPYVFNTGYSVKYLDATKFSSKRLF
jgi:uncharacterized protein YidB (DUF937 family)